MGTAFVEAMKAPPVQGVQKHPHCVRKRFRDRCVAAPMKEKAKKPAGLKTRPAWLWHDMHSMENIAKILQNYVGFCKLLR
jgi:hypothetical protein